MNLYQFFSYLTVALATGILFMALGLLMYNAYAVQREKSIQKNRAIIRAQLEAFIQGKHNQASLKKSIAKNSSVLISLIAQLSEKLSPAEHEKLLSIFKISEFENIVVNEINKLESDNWTDRVHAANYLPFIAQENAIVKPLIHSLEDQVLDVRLAAAHSLARLKSKEAVLPILNHLSLLASWPLQQVTQILIDMGDVAISPLLTYLRTMNTSDAGTIIAINVLGSHANSAYLSDIALYLDNPKLEIRIQAAKSLGFIHTNESLTLLSDSLQDTAWEVRAASARSLGLLKDDKAIPKLSKALTDSEWWVRSNAAHALLALGEAGIESLKVNLQNQDRYARDICHQTLQEHAQPTQGVQS